MADGEKSTKTEVLTKLRQQIQGLEGYKSSSALSLTTGIPILDGSLPGHSLPLAAIHEFLCDSFEDAAATNGFILALLKGVMATGGHALWINKIRTVFPPGLQTFGIAADRLIFINVARDREALWVMEEALRCKNLTAVIAEIPDADLTATRRLQLAVEQSGVTGFLLRHHPKKIGSSACVTRWQIKALPSVSDDGLPGVGFPCWNVKLLKARNGRPGQWPIEWKSGKFHLMGGNAEQQSRRPPVTVASRG